MGKHVLRRLNADWLFWVMAAFLALVFLTGGASRADALSLIVLRPAAVIILAFGLWRFRRRAVVDFMFLYLLALCTLISAIIHMMPLSPAVWHSLPGRELVAELDRLAGLGDVWRPLSLVPAATSNAFYALLVPIAVLVLASQLDRELPV